MSDQKIIHSLISSPLSFAPASSSTDNLALSASPSSCSLRSATRKMIRLTSETPRLPSHPPIVWFGEEQSTEISLVGGKGASLSVLQSVPGIRVPEGFIVTTEVYREFISSHPELQRAIAVLDKLSDAWILSMQEADGQPTPEILALETLISDQSVAVYNLFLNSPLSSQIANCLTDGYAQLNHKVGKNDLPVAVRSSATAEDLPNASFAGQHDTFLNQKGETQLLHSTLACWASLFHPHTVQYRNQLRHMLLLEHAQPKIIEGLKHGKVALAVVVQRSLQASVAGVGFNVNPSGDASIHIETNYGLGETVVSGLANPDTWEFDSEAKELLFSQIGDKEIQAVSIENGDIDYVPVSELDRHRFSIPEYRAREIAESIAKIGDFYQDRFGYKFIDTEFAFDEHGTLYFLQTRPETVFSSSAEIAVLGVEKETALAAPMLFHGGANGYPGAVAGRIVYARTPQEALEKIRPGDILVASKTTPEWTIVFPKLGGIIVDVGGVLSHTAIVGREQRIPTLLSTGDATKKLAEWDGKIVTLDATNSVVYEGALPLVTGNIKQFIREDLHNSHFVQDLEIQTHRIDEEGKWMSRPNQPLTPMQLDCITRAYDSLNELLELPEPIRYKIIGQKIYVQIEDADGHSGGYIDTTETFLNWGLDRLEGFFDHRIETVRQLQRAAEEFEATPEKLREMQAIYQDWMLHFLSRGRFGHGAVAIMMQEQMSKIADLGLLSSYLHLRYPMPNASNEKQKEHAAFGKQLSELGFTRASDPALAKSRLQKDHPQLWQEIVLFSERYEHTSSENLIAPIPTDFVLKQLLITLGDVEYDFEPMPLTALEIAKMDMLFATNKDLARTMILAHRHLYQKENEHHQIALAQHRIHRELLRLGEKLVESGRMQTAEEVFHYSMETLARIVENGKISQTDDSLLSSR